MVRFPTCLFVGKSERWRVAVVCLQVERGVRDGTFDRVRSTEGKEKRTRRVPGRVGLPAGAWGKGGVGGAARVSVAVMNCERYARASAADTEWDVWPRYERGRRRVRAVEGGENVGACRGCDEV